MFEVLEYDCCFRYRELVSGWTEESVKLYQHLHLITATFNACFSPAYFPLVVINIYTTMGFRGSIYASIRSHELLPFFIYMIFPLWTIVEFFIIVACLAQAAKIDILSNRLRKRLRVDGVDLNGPGVRSKSCRRIQHLLESLSPFAIELSGISKIHFYTSLSCLEAAYTGILFLLN